MKLPNAGRAVVAPAKVRDYLLSPSTRSLAGETAPRLVTAYPGEAP